MEKFKCGELETNCYVESTDGICFIVDPGENASKVYNYIKENDLEVKFVLLTHGHFDHMASVHLFNAPIYMHYDEEDLFKDDKSNLFTWLDKKSDFNVDDLDLNFVRNGDILDFANVEIEVIHTPGHTIGSVCYRYKNNLFTGDLIFKNQIGRTDLPSGNMTEMKDSILHVLEKMEDFLVFKPGHGVDTTVKDERINNTFYLHLKHMD